MTCRCTDKLTREVGQSFLQAEFVLFYFPLSKHEVTGNSKPKLPKCVTVPQRGRMSQLLLPLLVKEHLSVEAYAWYELAYLIFFFFRAWNTRERSRESGLCFFSLSYPKFLFLGEKDTYMHTQASLTTCPTAKCWVSLGSIFFHECCEEQKEWKWV